MTIKELREQSGMSLTQFSAFFEIPYRTLQHWEHGTRKCPEYLLKLMEYKLKHEGVIRADKAMCLYCGNSLSATAADGTDVLVCFDCAGNEGKEIIVDDDSSCPNYNGK